MANFNLNYTGDQINQSLSNGLNSVLCSANQNLDSSQKTNARANIGAAALGDITSLNTMIRSWIAPDYSESQGYAVGDLVFHQYTNSSNNTVFGLYKCTTTIGSSGESWNASHWSSTTLANELN